MCRFHSPTCASAETRRNRLGCPGAEASSNCITPGEVERAMTGSATTDPEVVCLKRTVACGYMVEVPFHS
jgi:hypothetical protein